MLKRKIIEETTWGYIEELTAPNGQKGYNVLKKRRSSNRSDFWRSAVSSGLEGARKHLKKLETLNTPKV